MIIYLSIICHLANSPIPFIFTKKTDERKSHGLDEKAPAIPFVAFGFYSEFIASFSGSFAVATGPALGQGTVVHGDSNHAPFASHCSGAGEH
ncbi:MAG: hypothetical protein PHX24_10080 [Acidithiobacillus sp.]|nr:hypothetical protein [Acidithiobacillus sp.]